MRIVFPWAILLLCNLQVISQITFERTYGTTDDDAGAAIEVCHDGTYILTGTVDNIYSGDPDVFLARINQYGDTIWTRTFGAVYEWEVPGDVKQASDLGFIITGYTYVNDTTVPFLLKYDEKGRFMWFKTYGSQVPDGYGYVVLETPDAGYMICGRRDYYNADWYSRPFMLETDNEGHCIWNNVFTFSAYSMYEVFDMCLSPDNEYILCGEYEDWLVSSIEHSWLFKVGAGMNVDWTKIYGPEDSTSYAMDVEPTEDGGYLLCGSIFHGDIYFPEMDVDIYLVKTNSSGEQEWTKSIGDEGHSEHGSCTDKAFDGGYIIGGSTEERDMSAHSDIWLVKSDENGDTIWTRKFGGVYSEGLTDICATPDGGFLFCGYTDSYGLGGSDIYLVKTNENGLLTGIGEERQSLSEIEVIPNPGYGILHLRNCRYGITYWIYDVNGRIIVNGKQVKEPDEMIDISHVAPGIYILQIVAPSQTRSIKLLISR